MPTKSSQLQIRVTPREKAALRKLAAAAGQDLSSYILSRALPSARLRFEELLSRTADETSYRYSLAALNDLLTSIAPADFAETVALPDPPALSPFLQNYVAAMVEQAAHLKEVPPPAWTGRVPPLATPYFAAPLRALRLHLLRASPVPFKRRNLFVDSSVGQRV